MGRKDILDTCQGAIAEHIVAQELRVVFNDKYIQHLNFWVRDKQGTSAEVDFIWQSGLILIPIEVKSGHNAHLRSLQSFMDLSSGDIAVRIWSGPYSIDQVSPVFRQMSNFQFYLIHNLCLLMAFLFSFCNIDSKVTNIDHCGDNSMSVGEIIFFQLQKVNIRNILYICLVKLLNKLSFILQN